MHLNEIKVTKSICNSMCVNVFPIIILLICILFYSFIH